MQILIVGAGAVGQVYGRHLAAAGHAVTFFVKPAHAAALQAGLALHRLGLRRVYSQHWHGYAVLDAVAAVAAQRWDQVWLCVAADALAAPLTTAVLGAVGPATVVCLQPGPESVQRVQAALPPGAALVQGLITFISYASPLPGTPGPEGLAYFLPPLLPGLFSGPPEPTAAVVAALRRGGMAARAVRQLAAAAGAGEALLIPLVAALEVHGWTLRGFAGSPAFALGRAAAGEVLALLAATRGLRPGPYRALLSAPVSRLWLALAPRLLPLPLEPYLRVHFSKVGQQTRDLLEGYAALGARQGLSVTHLRELRSRLP